MIRASWITAVGCALVLAGAGWGQSLTPERIISVKEQSKPAQKCRVLKCWTEKDGSRVCQVQALDTGEMMTIMESGPLQPAAPASSGNSIKALSTRIFHWGRNSEPPTDVPAAPRDAVVVGQPQPATGAASSQASESPSRRWRLSGLFASSRSEKTDASCPCAPGKVERWSTQDSARAQADAVRKAEFASSQPLARQVETAGFDPLLHPEIYTRADLGTAPVEKPDRARRSMLKPVVTAVELPIRKSKEAVPGQDAVPGMGSVMAAARAGVNLPEPTVVEPMVVIYEGQPVLVQPGQVLPGRAPRKLANAFTDVPAAPAPRTLANGPPVVGPGYISLAATAPAEGAGVPSAMANAFTTGGTGRPIPADMGTPYATTGQRMVLAPTYPVMPGSYPADAMPGPAMVQESSPPPHLLTTLRDSLYPSEREMAAEELAHCDWRAQPGVVQALVTAAKTDPAPLVRVSCVRALGRMKANIMPVVSAVQGLKADADLRVRQEVEHTLGVLSAP
jgi:hypothetical protein